MLEHLIHIDIATLSEVKDNPDQKETVLSCTFTPNEFFENEKLTTRLLYDKDELLKSVGTEIKWKKNPTIKKVTKTQKNKRSGQTRTITKEEQLRTFFEIFNDFVPDEEKEDDNEQGEEPRLDLFLLEETLNEMSESVPYALEYYLGIVDDEEDLDGDDGEDDEDEDDEDEDDQRHPAKKKGKQASRKESGNANPKTGDKADPKDAGKKQECKQQ